MTDINHEHERADGVPCANNGCSWHDYMQDQNCKGESPTGTPAIEFCVEYVPEV